MSGDRTHDIGAGLGGLRSWPFLLLLGVLLLEFWPPASLSRSLQRLDGMFYDAKVAYLPRWPASVANIQIVDIDDRSLAEIGRMPWDRRVFAQLTQRLAEAGAVLLVFDVLFSEAQTETASSVVQQWPGYQTLTLAAQQSLRQYLAAENPDQQFAASLQQIPVVLANVLLQPALPQHQSAAVLSAAQPTALRQNDAWQKAGREKSLPVPQPTLLDDFRYLARPVAPLADAAAGQGFINAQADADGFIRRSALLLSHQQQLQPSLALQAYLQYSLLQQMTPLWSQTGPFWSLRGITLGKAQVRTDQLGRVLLPFRGGAQHYPYTPAADVLAGRVSPQRFDGAVVFIGTSAAGLADLAVTPTSQQFPGVEIHATLFDALLAPEYLPYRPDWWQGAVLLQLLCLAAVAIWLLPGLSPLATSLVCFLMLAVVLVLNLGLWWVLLLDLPLLSALLLVVLQSSFFMLHGFAREARRRTQIKSMFAQYLPPAHLERLLRTPQRPDWEGEKKHLTVLFCDICGFTSIAEQMPAQQLKLWLNRYFSALTAAILTQQGTVDKYVGDMVMAFWGAPLDEPHHAEKAVQAALAMQQALQQLNQQFQAEQLPTIAVGIGIHTGEMSVGDMGSDFRRSYTVIGDAVNLGARLESLTRFYQVPLLLSAATVAQLREPHCLLIDRVRVKGKQQVLQIYMPLPTPLSASEQWRCQQFEAALAAYQAAEFERAMQLLSALPLVIDSAVSPHLLQLYLKRIHVMRSQPAPADWDGSYQH